MPIVFLDDGNQSLSPEDDKAFENLVKSITDKVFSNNPKNLASFAIPICIPRTPEIERQVAEKGLAKVRLEHLKTAFEKPQELQGLVAILIDDEKIFHVEDGEIIKDSLNLISNQWVDNIIKECFDTAKREVEGKDLVEYITAMMEIFGKYNPENNLLHYKSKNYIFNQKDEQLKVTAKDDGREVLNNSGFTKAAADSDMAALQLLKDIVVELIPDDDLQAQRPSLKL
jgi:hypothetical protein